MKSELSGGVSAVSRSGTPAGLEGQFSPLRFLVITIGGIFLAEVAAMALIYRLDAWPYFLKTLVDAGVMVIMIYPLIYFLSLKPLIGHIEERRRVEEQLHEMALFPALNPNAVLQVDDRGYIRTANPVAVQFGLSAGAHLIEQVPDLIGLDLPGCISAGTTQQVMETKLGGRFLMWTIRGVTDLGLAFLYSTDITERRLAEEANRQLSSIVEQTEDTVVVTDCEGVIEYVNPAFERLTGYTREEALGRTPRVIKSGIHDEEFYRNLWNTILNGEVFQGEMANRKKNGELFYEVKTVTPLRDAQGSITHFVATGKDITQHKLDEQQLRKAYEDLERRVQARTEELRIANFELEEEIGERLRAEQALLNANEELQATAEELRIQNDELLLAQTALRESEERFRDLVENAPVGIYEMDLVSRKLVSVNDVLCREVGFTREELLSMDASDLLVGEHKQKFLERLQRLMSGQEVPRIVEYQVRAKSGEVRWVLLNVNFTRRDGIPVKARVTVTDITERKQAEEQMKLFNRAMVGRELRMIELKKEVNKLCESDGQPPRYPLEFEKE